MGLRVKICGLTNLTDALGAVDAGADAIGLVFCESSPRFLTIPAAAKISEGMPPFVARVGVFANASPETVENVLAGCQLDVLQFHGDEPPDYCRRFKLKVIKGFRLRNEQDFPRMLEYTAETWLLDSYVPGQLGGTGARCNWELARQATQLSSGVILAGGLNPGNVAQAVLQVRPYAVDVSSGVESAPGRKDLAQVRDFIQAAKAVSEVVPCG